MDTHDDGDDGGGIPAQAKSTFTTHPSIHPSLFQAFEAYDQSNAAAASGSSGSAITVSTSSAVSCLKYMVLCKVLHDSASEVPALLASRIGMKHSGTDLEAMAAIAKAAKTRSLEEFQAAVS